MVRLGAYNPLAFFRCVRGSADLISRGLVHYAKQDQRDDSICTRLWYLAMIHVIRLQLLLIRLKPITIVCLDHLLKVGRSVR